jgi:hypothetical protein
MAWTHYIDTHSVLDQCSHNLADVSIFRTVAISNHPSGDDLSELELAREGLNRIVEPFSTDIQAANWPIKSSTEEINIDELRLQVQLKTNCGWYDWHTQNGYKHEPSRTNLPRRTSPTKDKQLPRKWSQIKGPYYQLTLLTTTLSKLSSQDRPPISSRATVTAQPTPYNPNATYKKTRLMTRSCNTGTENLQRRNWKTGREKIGTERRRTNTVSPFWPFEDK